ncbi:MAG: helix-turn-helix domain-containing protein [Actinomycetota bacterium]
MPRLLMVREVARRLGVHENTVRNWERRGVLHAIRLPGSGFRRFQPDEVDRMWEEMTSHLAPADTGPVIEPRIPIGGEIIHGDLT